MLKHPPGYVSLVSRRLKSLLASVPGRFFSKDTEKYGLVLVIVQLTLQNLGNPRSLTLIYHYSMLSGLVLYCVG